jgi:uncharacterized protein YbjT (DUF2867 family)
MTKEKENMKIVVIGGTGLIGSKLVTKLGEYGHEAVAAAPNSGARIRLSVGGLNNHAVKGGNEVTLTPGTITQTPVTRAAIAQANDGLRKAFIKRGKAALEKELRLT